MISQVLAAMLVGDGNSRGVNEPLFVCAPSCRPLSLHSAIRKVSVQFQSEPVHPLARHPDVGGVSRRTSSCQAAILY